MTRDEIYDHLAKVYLGKKEHVTPEVKEPESKSPFNAWLLLNGVVTALILASVFYGFTAFLAHRSDDLKSQVMYSLTNSPIRINYDVNQPYPQMKTFSLRVPKMDLERFTKINMSLKGADHGYPGVIKMVLRNERNEVASYYLQGIADRWQKQTVLLSDLDLTDWSTVEEMSFVIEAWNADKKAGTLLVDDISFSN